MKKTVLLLVIAVTLITAPSLLACVHCKPINQSCAPGTIGALTCDWDDTTCILTGSCHGFAPTETPLAADFTVASVERLDQPNTNAAGAQLSRLDSPTTSRVSHTR
jgi:hypothetical protein